MYLLVDLIPQNYSRLSCILSSWCTRCWLILYNSSANATWSLIFCPVGLIFLCPTEIPVSPVKHTRGSLFLPIRFYKFNLLSIRPNLSPCLLPSRPTLSSNILPLNRANFSSFFFIHTSSVYFIYSFLDTF